MRKDNSLPFCKLSSGIIEKLKRGWMRKTTRTYKEDNSTYNMQCTIWKDEKQVLFLHTNLVKGDGNTKVKRHVKGERKRVNLDALPIQPDCVQYYNAVDINDRDSVVYSCSVRKNMWYLRVFFWLLDRVVHCCYCYRSG